MDLKSQLRTIQSKTQDEMDELEDLKIKIQGEVDDILAEETRKFQRALYRHCAKLKDEELHIPETAALNLQKDLMLAEDQMASEYSV